MRKTSAAIERTMKENLNICAQKLTRRIIDHLMSQSSPSRISREGHNITSFTSNKVQGRAMAWGDQSEKDERSRNTVVTIISRRKEKFSWFSYRFVQLFAFLDLIAKKTLPSHWIFNNKRKSLTSWPSHHEPYRPFTIFFFHLVAEIFSNYGFPCEREKFFSLAVAHSNNFSL